MMGDFPIQLRCTCGPNHLCGSKLVYSEQVLIDGLNGATRPHPIDRCIAFEVMWLNERGITILGSCCGHNKLPPLLSTDPDQGVAMVSLGYVQSMFHRDDAGGRWWIGWQSRSLAGLTAGLTKENIDDS
jgi:hypothetical protein